MRIMEGNLYRYRKERSNKYYIKYNIIMEISENTMKSKRKTKSGGLIENTAINNKYIKT